MNYNSNVPLVSIIIPAFNDENDIRECLDSVIKQTLQNIEIIVIDDCSTDNTVGIIKEYMNKDERIILFEFDENKSAFQARKTGVMAAKGKYIMFADADDYLEYNACEVLIDSMEKNPVDILHFGTKVINLGTETKERLENYAKNLNSSSQSLYGEEIFKDFIKRKYEGHLWNKIYTAKLCKNVLMHTKDLVLPKAQDKYFYWMLAYTASTYRCQPELLLYNYKYGAGVEGSSQELSIEKFSQYCTQAWSENAIDDFMSDKNKDGKYGDILFNSRFELISHSVKNWKRLSVQDRPAGFDMMLDYWNQYEDKAKILCSIAGHYWNEDSHVILDSLQGSQNLNIKPQKVKTIGTYYHRYYNGGIQRVLSKLMQIWIDNGYNVVFFTDYDPNPNDYILPEGVVRVKLGYPASATNNSKQYRERALSLAQYIKEYNVDCMVYHNYFSNTLLWDNLICKLYNVPFILFYHNTFIRFLQYNDDRFYSIAEKATLFDGMCVLSREDEEYWKHFSKNVKYILNPLTFDLDIKENIKSEKSDKILWLGRMDDDHKQPHLAITMMKDLVKICPDVKLLMVGDNDDPNYLKRLQARIDKLNLTNNIELCGFHKDVEVYYKQASIFLMTSAHEGFPLALGEALSFGLPVVMFDLPYLELVKNNEGIISIKNEDCSALANAVAELLNDEEKRSKMAEAARNGLINMYESSDIGKEWTDLFNAIEEERVDANWNENDLFRLIIKGYKSGMIKKNKINIQSKEAIEKAQAKISELEKKTKELEKKNKELLKQPSNGQNLIVVSELQQALINQYEMTTKHTERFITLIEECKHGNDKLNEKNKELNFVIDETRKSFTYKIGRFFTFIPRRIILMFKGNGR